MRTKTTIQFTTLGDYAERDLSLYRTYCDERRRWLAEGRDFTGRELIEHVIKHCPSRFFMSYDRAIRVALRCRSEQITVGISPLKRLMWREFLQQVEQYRQLHPRATLHRAVAYVLAFGWASRYYISYDWAKHVIGSIRHLPLDERRRLLGSPSLAAAQRG